ncbi:hypothetical protein D1BOALGB6SA_10120 [Olavius sp. associated proteobacterium Delta 1]|nr:hypothetical protein D1BOALGB6SA_10120 [Olavius sp. associated proteobacterium Delta 1]
MRSFYQKPRKLAEWMIGSGIGCCLRPLGIVMNEQLCTTVLF